MKSTFQHTAIVFVSILFCMGIHACSKDDDSVDDPSVGYEDFAFIELKASSDTIRAGFGRAAITAVATGAQLQYHWSACTGTISGSGKMVEFHTSFCTMGTFTITCIVKDKRGYSDTKTIEIVTN